MTDTSQVPSVSESQIWLAERQPSGFLVALWLDGEAAGKLAVEGGEEASSLHITLAYVQNADEIDELTQARVISAVYDEVKYSDAPSGTIAGYGRFHASDSSDGQDVFYLTPDIPRLFDLRQRIVNCLSCNGLSVSEQHGYTPHITLSYLDPESDNPQYEVPELELKFSAVTVMSGSRRTDIPFWTPSEQEIPIAMSESKDLPLEAPLGSHPARPLFFGSFDKEWIPFLPKPGTYHHEVFGDMDLTSDTYNQILENFNGYVYKQDLPIRATHTPAEAGAVGWIKPGGMRLAEDGSLEVKPEWNELGKGLVEDDRFRYVSAEFCRQWRNPVTQELHENVAVGLALVTRPHFKTDVLEPLSASEALAFGEVVGEESTETPVEQEGTEVTVEGTQQLSENPNPSGGEGGEGGANPTPAPAPTPTPAPAPTPPAPPSVTLSDLTQVVLTAEQRQNERQMFADLTTRVELAERRANTAEAELKRINTDRRTEKFTAEVLGRSAENGTAWFGDPKANIEHLVSLSEQFGDESPELRWAITQKRNEAKAIRATGIFDPIALGGGVDTAASADAQVTRLAEQYRQQDSSLTMEKATAKVYETHPDLYLATLKK